MIELGELLLLPVNLLKVGDLTVSSNDSLVENGKTHTLVPANGSWTGSADTFPELAAALRKNHIKHIAPVDLGLGFTMARSASFHTGKLNGSEVLGAGRWLRRIR